jgi:hypothetical protein
VGDDKVAVQPAKGERWQDGKIHCGFRIAADTPRTRETHSNRLGECARLLSHAEAVRIVDRRRAHRFTEPGPADVLPSEMGKRGFSSLTRQSLRVGTKIHMVSELPTIVRHPSIEAKGGRFGEALDSPCPESSPLRQRCQSSSSPIPGSIDAGHCLKNALTAAKLTAFSWSFVFRLFPEQGKDPTQREHSGHRLFEECCLRGRRVGQRRERTVWNAQPPALACHVSHRSRWRRKNCSNHLAARQPDDHASALCSRPEPGPLGRTGRYVDGLQRANLPNATGPRP